MYFPFTYMFGGSQDCKTLWFPCKSVRLAIILECKMTTWLGSRWGFSKWPADFHAWHFCSTSDNFIRTWAIAPISKTSRIRAQYGVFRYFIRLPISFLSNLLLYPVLWLLALERLALSRLFALEDDPLLDSEFTFLVADPLGVSLFLKWLLTWRSSKLCKKKHNDNLSSFWPLFLSLSLPECQIFVYIHPQCIGMAYCLHGSKHAFLTKLWKRNLYRKLCNLPIDICTVECIQNLVQCYQSHLFGFLPQHEQSEKKKNKHDYSCTSSKEEALVREN